jgi:hypothetical protein
METKVFNDNERNTLKKHLIRWDKRIFIAFNWTECEKNIYVEQTRDTFSKGMLLFLFF